MVNKNTFCIHPWRGISANSNGSVRVCCMSTVDIPDVNLRTHSFSEISASPWLDNLRMSLKHGIKHRNCNSCWGEEAAGIISKRQRDTNLNNLDEPTAIISIVDLKLGNLCNLKCRICSPKNSSKWYQEWMDLKVQDSDKATYTSHIKSLKTVWDSNSKIWDNIQASVEHIEHIDLFGGEPLINERLWELLSYVKSSGYASQISIHMNTNGSVRLTDEQWDTLSGFKYTDFQVSLDDIGARHTYQRHPSKWEEVKSNVLSYKEKSWLRLNTNITVSLFNLYYIDEIAYEINRQLDLHVHFNYLHRPEQLSVVHLSSDIKQILVAKMQNSGKFQDNIDAALNRVASAENPDMIKSFLTEVEMHDKYRNESFAETFPEWYALLMKHYG